jgi:hypothetical protein
LCAQVPLEAARAYAEEHGLAACVETSAKTAEGVNELFALIAQRLPRGTAAGDVVQGGSAAGGGGGGSSSGGGSGAPGGAGGTTAAAGGGGGDVPAAATAAAATAPVAVSAASVTT